jgi:hypothetical protein
MTEAEIAANLLKVAYALEDIGDVLKAIAAALEDKDAPAES